MFDFVEIWPTFASCTKRLVGEQLIITAKLKIHEYNKETPPQSLFVEVWTDLLDDTHHAIHMPFLKKEEGLFLYQLKIVAKRTGFFGFNVRARLDEHGFWSWASGNAHKPIGEILVDPAWVDNLIVYNAFVRFYGARSIDKSGIVNPGEGGTFDHLKDHLDRLKAMNINVLYLNPIHMIGELYRNYNPHDLLPAYLQPGCPYSIKDYKSIDPELAYDEDHGRRKLSDAMTEFKELVKAAHDRGIRVFMDIVFNHTAHDAVIQRLHPEWYLYKEHVMNLDEPYIYPEEIKQGKPWGDPKHTFSPFDHGYWWGDTAQVNWELDIPQGANDPPKNPTLGDMWEYFKSITKFWVKHVGVDGFRCDVAYRVPAAFWRQCISETRQIAKSTYPANGTIDGDVIFIAETYVDRVQELLRAGFTACYGDYGNKLYNVQSLKGYLDYMYNVGGTFFPDGSRFFIFPECHDFHRTPSKIAANKQHEMADFNANKSRWTLTATLPGIPMIFNGFEKIEWHPVNLFSYSAIDWEADKDLTEHIAKINKIRHDLIALQKGNYQHIRTNHGEDDQAKLFSFLRTHKNQKVLVVINMDVEHATEGLVYLDEALDTGKEYVLRDTITNKSFARKENGLYVSLGAGDAHIFEVIEE